MLPSAGTFFDLIVFVMFGIIAGLVLNVFKMFTFLSKNNLIVTYICDFFAVFSAGLVLLLAIFRLNDGAFAFFELVGFAVGIAFELIFIKNLFVSPLKVVYNKLTLRKNNKKQKDKEYDKSKA